MRTAFFIAKRYLVAKKSHNVINIISGISAAGIAVGTAALIVILSVYNGFSSMIKDMMTNVEPDLLVATDTGKTFVPDDGLDGWIASDPNVASVCRIIDETVFISYDGKQKTALARGVDSTYIQTTTLKDHLYEGKFELYFGDIPKAIVGIGLAAELGIRTYFLSPIEIYFPSRTQKFSTANPISAIGNIDVFPSGIFSVNNGIDQKLMLVPLDKMKELLEYDDEITGLEIRFKEGTSAEYIGKFRKTLAAKAGGELAVKDRFMQNESLYKMLKYEKAVIFMILIFVILITAFNIFGSLSMLIIEKRSDIRTLRNLGATDSLIKRIFTLEGWMVCLTGMTAGLVAGIGFSLAQQYFGFIPMPGNFVIDAYPVIISWRDVLVSILGISAIGYLISSLPTFIYCRKFERSH